MRITHESLLKLAKDTVEKRFAPDPRITAVFLVGSLRPEHTIVTGAADVDLLVLHNGELPREREIVKLSNEYHLDIAYEDVNLYAHPRELRGEGWRGWAMWNPRLLFQRGRFFEYTQSVVRAQFEEPANIIKRARYFSEPARQAWTEMQLDTDNIGPLKVLDAVFNAANAIASLTGEPITERWLLADFPERAESIDRPALIHSIFASTATNLSVDTIQKWLPNWEEAFRTAAQSPADLRLHPVRLAYYRAAIDEQLASDVPRAALWPMLYTWALAAENGTLTEVQAENWNNACAEAGLIQNACQERLEALDGFLDDVEELLEQIAMENGL